MKHAFLPLFTASLLAVAAGMPGALAAPTAAPPALDTIYLKAGTQVTGNITSHEGNNLKMESRFAGGAVVTKTIPVASVDRVEFAGSSKLQDELAKAQAADVGGLLQKWRTQRSFLDIPRSLTGAIGLRAAQLLLESGNPEAAASAGEILDQIVKNDWDADRRSRARTLAIEAVRSSGRHDEMIKASRALLAGDADAESKAEVSYYLALALNDDYKAFIKENPRWESDPIMRPKRNELFNDVIDCLLAPYLSYGAPPEFTAKSLLVAANLLNEADERDNARYLARDIVTLFPAQPESADAKKFLEETK